MQTAISLILSVIANDINERKQTEAALAASEQNFRNSIDNSLMGRFAL